MTTAQTQTPMVQYDYDYNVALAKDEFQVIMRIRQLRRKGLDMIVLEYEAGRLKVKGGGKVDG